MLLLDGARGVAVRGPQKCVCRVCQHGCSCRHGAGGAVAVMVVMLCVAVGWSKGGGSQGLTEVRVPGVCASMVAAAAMVQVGKRRCL